jgi:hypothetical protein
MKRTVPNITRRDFLAATAAGATFPRIALSGKGPETSAKVAMLHATDLFRPHNDPDDHWDLACVYALARRGDIDLKGILIDYPPNDSDPDVMAVAQMNFITGLAAPVIVGSPPLLKTHSDSEPPAGQSDSARMVLDVLRQSTRPVVINITGCCRDIAAAAKAAPRLFAEKCAAIYLNAGAGSPDKELASKLEYNVSLDPPAYAVIFNVPCPLYWMPCFESASGGQSQWAVKHFGTFYKFRQSEILPNLPDKMQNYFAYALGKVNNANWLQYLTGSKDERLLAEHGGNYRNMWCTGGFLHAAGKTVSRSGEIVPLNSERVSPVVTFDPIKVRCSDDGVTEWAMDDKSKDRYIFHVRDVENYESAMTAAMKSLLMSLP